MVQHPLPPCLCSFTWFHTICLLFQMRFQRQLPTMILAVAINTRVIPAICLVNRVNHPEMAPATCTAVAGVRAAGLALAALLVVFCLEARSRRLWLLRQGLHAAPPRGG